MDQLSIEVRPEEAKGQMREAIGLHAIARVNGLALPDILDVDAFFEALTDRGRLPLFTCECGDFGCGGAYVDISGTDAEWIWGNRYAPSDPERAALMYADQCCFSWTNARSVAIELLALLHPLHRERPQALLMSAQLGVDLSARLPHYEAQIMEIMEHSAHIAHPEGPRATMSFELPSCVAPRRLLSWTVEDW